jgi:integration host factor subunit beta
MPKLTTGTPLTKRDLLTTFSERTHLPQDLCSRVMDSIFTEISRALTRKERVELRNFCIFDIKTHAPRQARNPQTGEIFTTKTKPVISFRPGKAMKERINRSSH